MNKGRETDLQESASAAEKSIHAADRNISERAAGAVNDVGGSEKKVDGNSNARHGRGLMFAILSLSLLTVMAGAAVAPALGTIREHFTGYGDTTVQLIISMPALFIFLTSFIFPRLSRVFGARTLVMLGLILYVAGGCGAALFDSIWIVLIFRALVGCGVGFIMPLSTGLLSFYYPPEQLDRLMGLSSAMNQMGGAVATFIAGILATISWRAAFFVYAMGLISVVLCLIFLPNDRIVREHPEPGSSDEASDKTHEGNSSNRIGNKVNEETDSKQPEQESTLRRFGLYVGAMFVLMSTFFIYPSNFALETASAGIMPQEMIATVMALMDVVAFAGGLSFVGIKARFKANAHFAAPLLFLAGYMLLAVSHGVVLTIAGSFCIGFANGAGIPCIIASASRKAGKSAATTVMPMLSAAMYMGQFLSPFIMSIVTALLGRSGLPHLPFCFAALLAAILAYLANCLRKAESDR